MIIGHRSGIEAELVDAMAWIGAENFLIPLINSLLPRYVLQVAGGVMQLNFVPCQTDLKIVLLPTS